MKWDQMLFFFSSRSSIEWNLVISGGQGFQWLLLASNVSRLTQKWIRIYKVEWASTHFLDCHLAEACVQDISTLLKKKQARE